MSIQIKDLCKQYGALMVLDHLTLSLADNQITVLMGPSGCGKTTLLHILMGLEQPDSGTITGMPAKMGAVFQENRLCEDFTVCSNIRLTAPSGCTDHVLMEHLKAVGLGDSFKKPVRELSGGMKRRVAIVRAILADADILFLDEPFTGLDEDTKSDVMDYVKKYAFYKTVLLVTHDIEEADYLDANKILLGE